MHVRLEKLVWTEVEKEKGRECRLRRQVTQVAINFSLRNCFRCCSDYWLLIDFLEHVIVPVIVFHIEGSTYHVMQLTECHNIFSKCCFHDAALLLSESCMLRAKFIQWPREHYVLSARRSINSVQSIIIPIIVTVLNFAFAVRIFVFLCAWFDCISSCHFSNIAANQHRNIWRSFNPRENVYTCTICRIC